MLWIKAFHIIFVVAWYAGLFYLPRLFVYHAVTTDEPGIERFKVMERKLLAITNIGAAGALGLGAWLVIDYWEVYASQGWLHAKLVLVAAQIAHHAYCAKLTVDFRHDRNRHGHVYYRFLNEVPALLLIGIVVLVVVKPF